MSDEYDEEYAPQRITKLIVARDEFLLHLIHDIREIRQTQQIEELQQAQLRDHYTNHKRQCDDSIEPEQQEEEASQWCVK